MKISTLASLLRPFTLIAPFAGVACAGLAAMGANSIPLQIPLIISIITAGISAALLNGASNAFNQVCDVEVDRINKPWRPIPSGKISRGKAAELAGALYFISLSIAFFVNFPFFLISAAAALITVAYSSYPLRLKNYLWISNAAIAVSRGLLLIVAGWAVVAPPISPAPWILGGIFGLFLLGAASTKDFADVKGDARYGTRTLPVVYGFRGAAKLIAPFLVFPFLLFPVAAFYGMLPQAAAFLAILSAWGAYAALLMLREPEKLALEANHPSWVQMYLIMIFGYLGIAISFWI